MKFQPVIQYIEIIYFPRYIQFNASFCLPVSAGAEALSALRGARSGQMMYCSTSDSDLSFASSKLWQPSQKFLCQEGITECK